MCKISSHATRQNPIFTTPQKCDFHVLRGYIRILGQNWKVAIRLPNSIQLLQTMFLSFSARKTLAYGRGVGEVGRIFWILPYRRLRLDFWPEKSGKKTTFLIDNSNVCFGYRFRLLEYVGKWVLMLELPTPLLYSTNVWIKNRWGEKIGSEIWL